MSEFSPSAELIRTIPGMTIAGRKTLEARLAEAEIDIGVEDVLGMARHIQDEEQAERVDATAATEEPAASAPEAGEKRKENLRTLLRILLDDEHPDHQKAVGRLQDPVRRYEIIDRILRELEAKQTSAKDERERHSRQYLDLEEASFIFSDIAHLAELTAIALDSEETGAGPDEAKRTLWAIKRLADGAPRA